MRHKLKNKKQIKGDGVKKYYELLGYDTKYWKSLAKEQSFLIASKDLKNLTSEEYINAVIKYKEFQYVKLAIPTKIKNTDPLTSEEINMRMSFTPSTQKVKPRKSELNPKNFLGDCPEFN